MNFRMMLQSKKSLRPSLGVTLLEILVSLLILSFGLLGVAGLQAVTASYKINSWARNSAALLLSDFAERVRANPAAATLDPVSGNSRYAFRTNWATQQRRDPVLPRGTADCSASASASCDYLQRASYDLVEWRKSVREQMPRGSVWVDGDRGAGYTVTLMWMDKDFTGTGSAAASLQRSKACGPGLTQVEMTSCCPDAAKVVSGVRCQNFFFIP